MVRAFRRDIWADARSIGFVSVESTSAHCVLGALPSGTSLIAVPFGARSASFGFTVVVRASLSLTPGDDDWRFARSDHQAARLTAARQAYCYRKS